MLQFVTQIVSERNLLPMVNTGRSKKIREIAVSAIMIIALILSLGVAAGAETYRAVELKVPRVSQRPGIGDCAIASMATVEAYCHGLPSGDYNSTAYKAVYSANGYSISANWSQLGFNAVDSFSMQTLYNQLKMGYPVIVHRTSSHYSVVYGYDGSTSSLEMSGFMIVDVDDSYNSKTAYKRLDKWKGSYSLDRMVLRLDGLNISSSSLKINGNHPAAYTAKGEKFTPYGRVISNCNITNVTVSVISAEGKTVQTYTAAPNAKSFAISQAGSKINISSLSNGAYAYRVYAKDASGASKTVSFNFGVGVAPAPISDAKTEPEETTTKAPEIKKVESYKVVINSDPSLNIRKSADASSQKLSAIPNGEIVEITAECGSWGMTSYKGYAGWICLDYVQKYTEPNPTVASESVVTSVSENARYARVIEETEIKSTKFIFSSSVGLIPQDAVIRVTGVEGDWLKIMYNGKEGYIMVSSCIADLFDIDGNGTVNSSDALCALEVSIGKRILTETQFKIADANGDGSVNSSDALIILAVATGEKTF